MLSFSFAYVLFFVRCVLWLCNFFMKKIWNLLITSFTILLSLDRLSEILPFVFILCPNRGLLKYIKSKVFNILFYLMCKVFSKNRNRFGTSLLASFTAWLLKKNVFLYSINWPSFIFCWLPLFREILGNVVNAIVC